MMLAARLTQRGHRIKCMDDLMALYDMPYTDGALQSIAGLPHPTLQKFSVITVAIVGASRRFLMQITRHQNEVKYMSASLQYSDYTGEADFMIPYEILTAPDTVKALYLDACNAAMDKYARLCCAGIGHDAAGYAMPHGLRNILIVSATPFQWKHIIGQRVCRRNTAETRYVLLRIWEQLYALSPALFSPRLTGPFCQRHRCLEGRMACGNTLDKGALPAQILAADFPAIVKEGAA